MRWQFTCLNCGESSDVAASQVTVTPSWVVASCLGCGLRCARPASGRVKLLLVTSGAVWVGDDPLTEWDVREFADDLAACDPGIQLQAESA